MMDGEPFYALARLVWTRQSRRTALAIVLGAALLGTAPDPLAAKGKHKHKRRQKQQRRRGQERQYPIFTTCHTASGEVGTIPDGPHPTCQSRHDPNNFVPCNGSLSFDDLKAKCDEAHAACNGDCQIKAEPTEGLGNCPDFWNCASPTMDQTPEIPNAPYESCWSGPRLRCDTCSGAKIDYQGLKDLCGKTYPAGQRLTCWDKLGRNDCYPIGS